MFDKINLVFDTAEKILGKAAPSLALARARNRHMLAQYEAAKPSRNRKMRGESRGPNVVANESLESLRAQARHLDENYDIVTGALDILVQRTVGAGGLMVEPMAKNKDGDLHDDFNRSAIELFNKYWELPEVSGEYSGAQAEQLAARTMFRDGEVFTQIIDGDRSAQGLRYSTKVPFSIELVEPDLVPLNFDDSGRRIFQGIEKNSWNRSVKYHVYRSHPNDYDWRLPSFEDLKEVNGDNFLHCKSVKRIGQTRGVSLLHSVIIRIEDLKDYEESERVAARIAAAAAFYIKKGNPDFYQPLDENDEERGFKMSPGMVFDKLQPGEEVGSIQSNRPSTLLGDFRNAMVRAIAAGIGVSYSSAAKDYNGSYSAQRQELVESYEGYVCLQNYFSSKFKKPIYQRFMKMAILSGQLKVPSDLDIESAYDVHMQGPAMPWIDPDKESKANERNNRAGYRSRSAIIRSRNENPIEVDQQLERERKREAKHGLILTSNAANDLNPADQKAEGSQEVIEDEEKA